MVSLTAATRNPRLVAGSAAQFATIAVTFQVMSAIGHDVPLPNAWEESAYGDAATVGWLFHVAVPAFQALVTCWTRTADPEQVFASEFRNFNDADTIC